MDEEEQDGRQTVPFADTLQKLNRGKTAVELGAALQQLTEAVMATHRAGTLTLQLKVSKSKASGMVEVADSWSVKAPRAEREVSMFYVDDSHNLVRDNPIQDIIPGIVRVADPVKPKAVSE